MSETETGEPTGLAPPADTTRDAWVGREANDVPPGWMDNVVKRLLEQMNRQLVRAEEANEDEANTPETRDAAANAQGVLAAVADAQTLIAQIDTLTRQ